MTKLWVDVVAPSVGRYKLRSKLTEIQFVVSAEESGAVADTMQIMAEQIDEYKNAIDKLHDYLKWIAFWAFLTGHFVYPVLTYALTFF